MNNTNRVVSNTEFDERVKAVKKKHLRAIHERLHDLTALKLSWEDRGIANSHASQHSKISHRIPVEIVVFDTASIMSNLCIDNEFDFWNALLRGSSDPVFDRLSIDRMCDDNDIPEIVEDILSKIRRLSDEPDNSGDSLSILLEKILREKWFGESDKHIEDVLGVFYCCDDIRIELYTQVIAYYSIILDVPCEWLAVVVLIHEQAHAYTMAGFDISGSRGELLCSHYDKYIIEGLAQYYTEAVCGQLEKFLPGVSEAFFRLRAGQSEPYTDYQKWMGSGIFDHERVRKALIEYRNYATRTYNGFLNTLRP